MNLSAQTRVVSKLRKHGATRDEESSIDESTYIGEAYVEADVEAKVRVEDSVADKLEEQGYVVFRTYKAGCPDLIAVKPTPEIKDNIKIREVKGPGDIPRFHQITTIKEFIRRGFDAKFLYTETGLESDGTGHLYNRLKKERQEQKREEKQRIQLDNKLRQKLYETQRKYDRQCVAAICPEYRLNSHDRCKNMAIYSSGFCGTHEGLRNGGKSVPIHNSYYNNKNNYDFDSLGVS